MKSFVRNVFPLSRPVQNPTTVTAARSLGGTGRYFSTIQAEPVMIEYEDLLNGKDLSQQIEKAFGFEGLGLITVRNVPRVMDARKKCLRLAHEFARLPQNVKEQYERKETFYSFGWSHGKEIFEGSPDFAKGSYYANPEYDVVTKDEALIKQFPSYCSPNVWPTKHLPHFREGFMNMSKLIVDVGALVGQSCDRFLEARLPSYQPNRLGKIITGINEPTCHKARLLHYFPLSAKELSNMDPDRISSWCGWHNDHGSLTGLTSNMYLDQDGQEVPSPDPAAGLYIKTRNGGIVQAKYSPDVLAFQIGEAAQIHSGGLLQATPHSVRGATGPGAVGISRNTLAVFMQPRFTDTMNIPSERTAADAEKGSTQAFLPPGMPPLDVRWTPGIDFGTFTNQTIAKYH